MKLRSFGVIRTFALILTLSCDNSPVERVAGHSGLEPTKVILDGGSNGNPHFFFLPPLVALPAYSGSSDSSVRPDVKVCDLGVEIPTAASQCAEVVASFSTVSGSGGEVVRYDSASEQFHVNWRTDQSSPAIQVGHYYRVKVSVAGALLGFVDVTPVSGKTSVKNPRNGDVIPLTDGRTLPLKFRIEQGAVSVISGVEGGTVTALAGEVTLDFPAGAIDGELGITVEKIATVSDPTDRFQIAGTVVELGPDGAQFLEPVTLSLKYEQAAIPAGRPEESLRLYTKVGNAWELVWGSTVDLPTNTVTGQLQHFSTYSIRSMPRLAFTVAVGGPPGQGDTYTIYEDATGLTRVPAASANRHFGGHPAWSPDGERLAYMDLFVNNIALATPVGELLCCDLDANYVYTSFDAVVSMEWSPDGSEILYTTGNDLNIVPVDGSSVGRQVFYNPGFAVSTAQWSADGQRILFGSGMDGEGDIYSVDRDGNNLTRLTFTPDRWEGLGAWSADRTRILVFATANVTAETNGGFTPDPYSIHVWEPSTGLETTVTTGIVARGEAPPNYGSNPYPVGECWDSWPHCVIADPRPVWMPGESRIMFRRAYDSDGVTYNPQYIAVNLDGSNPTVVLDSRSFRLLAPEVRSPVLTGLKVWQP